jgi:hypothetical protein
MRRFDAAHQHSFAAVASSSLTPTSNTSSIQTTDAPYRANASANYSATSSRTSRMRRYPTEVEVKHHVARTALAALTLASLSTYSDAREVQARVTRASATVEPMPGKPLALVHLKNLGSVPIETWQIRLVFDLGSGEPSSLDITVDAALDPAPSETPDRGRGSIFPGATRDKAFALGGTPVSVSVSVLMVGFEDGSWEGSSDERALVFRKRAQHGASLALYADALESVSGQTPQQAKATLRKLLDSDRRFAPDPTDSWAKSLRQTLDELVSLPDVTPQFSARVADLKQRLKSQRDRATRGAVR